MNELAIDSKDLTKTYGSIRAVGGIKTYCAARCDLWVSGAQRCGPKQPRSKMLLGLTRPTAGAAHVLGMDVSVERMSIFSGPAFVSEKKTLYPSLTPTELVRFSRGFYPTWSDSSVEKYARLLEIPMEQRFEKLSNGNQTKVWLLLALSQGADLLILDEPTTTALGPGFRVDQLLHVLTEDGLDRGCTILFSFPSTSEEVGANRGLYRRHRARPASDGVPAGDDIKSEFRLITAAGNALPTQTSSQVLSLWPRGISTDMS